MAIGDKIRDEKFQYDIIRVAPKISALVSGKIDKYEYKSRNAALTGWQKRPNLHDIFLGRHWKNI